LAEWFTPHPAKQPWYRILAPSQRQGKSPMLAVQARGTLRVNRVIIRKVEASQVTAQLNLDQGKLSFNNARGQVFEGTHLGNWVIDVSTMPPHYRVTGLLQSISLAEVNTAMNNAWATGTADAKFDLTGSGSNFADLLAHANGELQWTLRNGTLTRLDLPDAGKPFPVHLLAAILTVKNGVWKLITGKLESHDGIYRLSGTISPGSALNLVLTRGDEQSWNITGTLLKPQATHANRTEARIKP
jgi:hypothetical protein